MIPLVDAFANIKGDRVLLDIEVATEPSGEDYSDLDGIIGMCSTGRWEDSAKHDQTIYRRGDGK